MMETRIVVVCLARTVGMEVAAIEVIFSETLGITDKCRITNALNSNESRLKVEGEMVKMRHGSFAFFLKPVGLSAYGLINFFSDGGEARMFCSNEKLQFSKIRTDCDDNLFIVGDLCSLMETEKKKGDRHHLLHFLKIFLRKIFNRESLAM